MACFFKSIVGGKDDGYQAADLIRGFRYKEQILLGQIGGAGFAAHNFKQFALARKFFVGIGKKCIGADGCVVKASGSGFDVVLREGSNLKVSG